MTSTQVRNLEMRQAGFAVNWKLNRARSETLINCLTIKAPEEHFKQSKLVSSKCANNFSFFSAVHCELLKRFFRKLNSTLFNPNLRSRKVSPSFLLSIKYQSEGSKTCWSFYSHSILRLLASISFPFRPKLVWIADGAQHNWVQIFPRLEL